MPAIRVGLSDIWSVEILEKMQAPRHLTLPNRGHALMLDGPDALAAIDRVLESLQP